MPDRFALGFTQLKRQIAFDQRHHPLGFFDCIGFGLSIDDFASDSTRHLALDIEQGLLPNIGFAIDQFGGEG